MLSALDDAKLGTGAIDEERHLGLGIEAERIARRAAAALPAEHPLRDAVWALLRPLLSPRLAELHRDAFAADADTVSTVDLESRRHESDLDELDLGEDIAA